MERFSGLIQNCFNIPEKESFVLMLTQVTGIPGVGITVTAGEFIGRVVDVGKNSTDGQIVSARSCLTGKIVPPYCSVAVEWASRIPDAKALRGLWLIEGHKSSV